MKDLSCFDESLHGNTIWPKPCTGCCKTWRGEEFWFIAADGTRIGPSCSATCAQVSDPELSAEERRAIVGPPRLRGYEDV